MPVVSKACDLHSSQHMVSYCEVKPDKILSKKVKLVIISSEFLKLFFSDGSTEGLGERKWFFRGKIHFLHEENLRKSLSFMDFIHFCVISTFNLQILHLFVISKN